MLSYDYSKKDPKKDTGLSSLYHTPTFKQHQKEFERRLGVYAYHDPRSYAAVNIGINKVKQVLLDYYVKKPKSTKENYIKEKKRILKNAFFANNANAGQVGTDITDEDVDNILGSYMAPDPRKATTEALKKLGFEKSGNLREKMTALENATMGVYNFDKNKEEENRPSFKQIMQDIVVNNRTDLIHKLSLDSGRKDIMDQRYATINRRNPELYENHIKLLNEYNSRSNRFTKWLYKIFHWRQMSALENAGVKDINRFLEIIENQKRNYTRMENKELFVHEFGLIFSAPNFSSLPPDVYDVEQILHDSQELSGYVGKTYPSSYQRFDDYAEKNETPRSSREIKFQENFRKQYPKDFPDPTKSIIKNGESLHGFKKTDKFSDDYGFEFITGSSITAARMLKTYKWLGLNSDPLIKYFRLALMGWMLPERDHSLYEILHGSHIAGIVGKENLTEAATMDETVDPLTEDELRKNVCEEYNGENLFPIEIAYLETHFNNSSPNFQKYTDISLLGCDSGYRTKLYDAKNLENLIPILGYTNLNYNFMINKMNNYPEGNMQLIELYIGSEIFKGIVNKFYKKRLIFSSVIQYITGYDISELMLTEMSKSDLKKCQKNISKISPKIPNGITAFISSYVYDYLKDLDPKKLPKESTDKAINRIFNDAYKKIAANISNILTENDRLSQNIDVENYMLIRALNKMPKFNGKVYSAQPDMLYNRTDITFYGFTSTSIYTKVAKRFLFSNRVMYVIKLNGKNGVNVSNLSTFNAEAEVLLMPNAKFKVLRTTNIPDDEDKLYEYDGKYIYLEEI